MTIILYPIQYTQYDIVIQCAVLVHILHRITSENWSDTFLK